MNNNENTIIQQYSLSKIIIIWLLVTVPIGICGWVLAPFLSGLFNNAGLGRTIAITIGLILQFILSLILLYKENGRLSLSIFKNGLLLKHPKIPGTDKSNKYLWLLLIPLMLLTAFYKLYISKYVVNWWTTVFPIFQEPSLYSMTGYISSNEGRNEISGTWLIFIVYVICAIFNSFLGEEVLFRGILLPRMNKVFGKFDWVINGILFGLYHVHQPWGILSSIIFTVMVYALVAKLFKSTWFSVILHSGQSIYLIISLLIMMFTKV